MCKKTKHVWSVFLTYICKVIFLTISYSSSPKPSNSEIQLAPICNTHPSYLQDLHYIYLYAVCHFWSIILFLDLK